MPFSPKPRHGSARGNRKVYVVLLVIGNKKMRSAVDFALAPSIVTAKRFKMQSRCFHFFSVCLLMKNDAIITRRSGATLRQPEWSLASHNKCAQKAWRILFDIRSFFFGEPGLEVGRNCGVYELRLCASSS